MLALVPILGTVAQAVLGGITVLTGLSPLIVGAHFLVSMVIVALVTMLVRRAGEPGDTPVTVVVNPAIRAGVHGLAAVMAGVVVVGVLVTSSGPHAGDARTPRLGPRPPDRLVAARRPGPARDRPHHRAARRAARPRARRPRSATPPMAMLLLMLAQGPVGYVQYFTGLPWVLVAVHVLGAVIVWWATVRFLLTTDAAAASPPPEQVYQGSSGSMATTRNSSAR